MATADTEDLHDLLEARRYALRVLNTQPWRSVYSWSWPPTRKPSFRDASSRLRELNSSYDSSSRTHEPYHHESSSSSNMRTACDTSSSMHITPTAETKESPDAAPTRTSIQIFIIMLAVTLSVFLAALDVSIVTTALPTIAESLGSSSGFTWIGSSYLLAQAATTPLWGKFSDIWGRKPVLLAAVGIFFVGSLICGVAENVAALIVGRSVQGLASGGLLVMDGIIIADLFSMRERGKYYGIIGSTWAIAGALGPLLGGIFADKASWHWCFLINLPVSAAVFAMILFSLHLRNPHTSARAGLAAIDYAGTLLVVLSVVLFLLGLSLGSTTHPWASAIVLTLLLAGLFTFILFLLTEAYIARYPVIPLHIFRSTSTIFCLIAGFIHGLLFIAVAFYLPLYFQAVFFATALQSGVWFLPFTFAISFSGAAGGIYAQKTGRYIEVIISTFALTTLGIGLFISLPENLIWARIIIYQIIAGIGIGPNFQILLIAIQSGLPQDDMAIITGVLNFVRTLAMPIGIVLGSVMLNSGLQHRAPLLLDSLGPASTALLTDGNAAANVQSIARLAPNQRAVASEALRESLGGLWVLFTCFAAVGLLASLLITRRALSSEYSEGDVGLKAEEAKRVQRSKWKTEPVGRPWEWWRRRHSSYRKMES